MKGLKCLVYIYTKNADTMQWVAPSEVPKPKFISKFHSIIIFPLHLYWEIFTRSTSIWRYRMNSYEIEMPIFIFWVLSSRRCRTKRNCSHKTTYDGLLTLIVHINIFCAKNCVRRIVILWFGAKKLEFHSKLLHTFIAIVLLTKSIKILN